MSVRERVLTIRLLEKAKTHSEYVKKLGVEVVEAKTDHEERFLWHRME